MAESLPMDYGAPRKIDWERFVFAGKQSARVRILMDWCNTGKPVDFETVDDLLRECWREGFKRGAGVARNQKQYLTTEKLWLDFCNNRTLGSWGGN